MLIADRLTQIKQQIRQAEQKYHREKNTVALLAVSKGQDSKKIEQAIQAGQYRFGENYLQEALSKIKIFQANNTEWHFIGNIQSNKTQAIAENFAWVHSISRIEIAQNLNAYRSKQLPPLNVCVQVNISEEKTKQGVKLSGLLELVTAVNQLERLKLRGLMAIPAPMKDFLQQRDVYQKVAQAQQDLIQKGLALDTLSMGMSHDFEAAIAAGSTMVRIGRAIFGER